MHWVFLWLKYGEELANCGRFTPFPADMHVWMLGFCYCKLSSRYATHYNGALRFTFIRHHHLHPTSMMPLVCLSLVSRRLHISSSAPNDNELLHRLVVMFERNIIWNESLCIVTDLKLGTFDSTLLLHNYACHETLCLPMFARRPVMHRPKYVISKWSILYAIIELEWIHNETRRR